MSKNNAKQTKWNIITGAPSSGITSLGNYLRFLGFKVIPEVARGIIDIGHSYGLKTDDVRADQIEFERNIAAFQANIEAQLDPNETLFIERGLIDCAAYDLPMQELQKQIQFKYNTVFFLNSLNFKQDYARTENFEEAKTLGQKIEQHYIDQDYKLNYIDKLPLPQRAQIIMDLLKTKPVNDNDNQHHKHLDLLNFFDS